MISCEEAMDKYGLTYHQYHGGIVLRAPDQFDISDVLCQIYGDYEIPRSWFGGRTRSWGFKDWAKLIEENQYEQKRNDEQ